MAYSKITIKIIKWGEYNPRKDFKKPWWFALSNTLTEDSDFFSFNHGEFKAWIYILSQASKKKSETVSIDLNHAERVSNISKKDFLSSSTKLESMQMIAVICTDSVQETNATLHNNTIQDITNKKSARSCEQPQASASHPKSLNEIIEFLILRNVKPNLSEIWLETFPEPSWIIQEVKKANVWEAANPRKKKKDFGKFMTNWLTRGWDSRKIESINKVKPLSEIQLDD